MKLYTHQLRAVQKLHNGCILCGAVGSGKSLTAIAWYYLENGGSFDFLTGEGEYIPMPDPPADLYIITTAKKRDSGEWNAELSPFLLSCDRELSRYGNRVVIDSWNNIGKYVGVENAYFLFDEQRVVGSGAWVKAFLKITRKNRWILLTATPGDTWSDYIPVFIANGFYKNRTEFNREHVVFAPYTNYPKVSRYLNQGRLLRYRSMILVTMDFERKAHANDIRIDTQYDRGLYRYIFRERWNPWTGLPIENAAELCYCLRMVVNKDESRQDAVLEIADDHPRLIVFYNFDYELEILRGLAWPPGTAVAEWNGHKHEELPQGERWVYLVQFNAGAEGWNCTTTDTILFFSQNYSYRMLVQAKGRIDRLNTPYDELYYYYLKSHSSIDMAIDAALREKRNFNENKFCDW